MRSAPRSENGRLNVTVVVVVRTVVTPHSTSAGQDQTKGSPDRLSREISGALAMAESEQPASELSDDGASTAENDSARPSWWVRNSPLRAPSSADFISIVAESDFRYRQRRICYPSRLAVAHLSLKL